MYAGASISELICMSFQRYLVATQKMTELVYVVVSSGIHVIAQINFSVSLLILKMCGMSELYR